ncbi:hypothetical protein EDF58_101581 [Novosphingobium sp. PhB57]|uniref:hypothetical protein n=1 Tax=Novosphingobium sp. PhB57 TaxID=2485107 RepID=UPI0010537662|nr:hypothetical protein [Novosphingobium sp. PhB57]TCU61267.1 hypothetical protein EDF58_101581 [Novosphingobium sp. PhB57]
MDVSVKYLRPNPKTGILEFRRTFPARLIRHARDDSGKKISEVKRSLGVRVFDAGRDGPTYRDLNELYERLAWKADKVATGSFDPITKPLIAYFAEKVRSEGLEDDEEVRCLRETIDVKVRRAKGLRETCVADLAECRQLRALPDIEGIVAAWKDVALDLTQGHGLHVDTGSEGFVQLCMAVNDAQIDVWAGILSRYEGDLVPTPALPEPPAATVPPKARPGDRGETFEAIALTLINKRRVDFHEPTKERVRGALRFLEEAVGKLTPVELTRERVSHYLNLLAERPSRLPKQHFHCNLEELAALYKDRDDVKRLTSKTIEAYCLALNARWKEAQSEGSIPETLASPFSGRKFSRKTPGPKAAKGFSPEELTAYFSMPAFKDGERPKRGKGEAIYWIPLLMLFTGARPEEVAQLLVADIFQHEQDGRWVIRFTDEGWHPVKGQQSLKTDGQESGRRTFPVPQSLIDLGLLAYRKSLQEAGEAALFPLLRRKGKRSGIYASFGEWMCEYVYRHGVLKAGAGRQPVREFRHTWTTAARASKIPREAMEYIQGHRPPDGGSSHEIYGERDVLGNWIDQLSFKVDPRLLVRCWRV